MAPPTSNTAPPLTNDVTANGTMAPPLMIDVTNGTMAPPPSMNEVKQQRVGRGTSKSFSMTEKLHLLSVMKEILPTDGNEWDLVLQRHNDSFASFATKVCCPVSYQDYNRRSTHA